MTVKDLYNLGDDTLSAKLVFIAGVITAAPTSFGLTAPQATAMSDAAEALAGLIPESETARAAAEIATAAKNAGRDEALATFATYLNLMYASPSVTDSAIMSLSLSPRSTTRTPVVPQKPTDFAVIPFADGDVTFKWAKNGNPYGVVYIIETASADAAEWSVVETTTKTRITLGGFTAGVPRWFRVRATKNGLSSLPTPMEGIYLPASGFSVQIAA